MTKGLDVIGAGMSRRVTAVDLVRETLRSAILRGDLPGETRLVQTEIAHRLGVSTTPVREAMRDLASDGLITLDSHRIGTVRKPDWNEMTEIVDIRRSLERLAITRCMDNLTDEHLREARRLADELADEEDLGSWVQKNRDFHSIFHRATSTSRLGNMLVALEGAGAMFVAQAQRFQPEIRRRAVADHYALLEAYAARNPDKAYEIQYTHISLPLDTFEMDD